MRYPAAKLESLARDFLEATGSSEEEARVVAELRQTSKMERFFSQTGTGVSGSSPWLHSREGSGLSTRGWLKSAEPVGRS